MLMPDMAKKLSDVSLKKFHDLENDCVLNNMTPVDMYLFLTSKYEQLLIEEKNETMRLVKEQAKQKLEMINEQMQNESMKVTAANKTKVKKIKKISRRRSWGVSSSDLKVGSTHSTEVKGPEMKNSHSVRSVGKSKKVIKKPQPKSLFSASHDPNDEADKRAVELGCLPAHETQHMSTADLPLCAPNGTANNLTGMSDLAFECKLCKKIFDTKNMLETHYAYSQMHAKNIQERDAKFVLAYKNAERLAKLARDTVSCFKDKVAAGKAMKRCKADGFMSLNQYRWRHAVSKTIDRFLATHYEQVLETLSFTPFDSKDVKLLYSGTKLFWRVKSTFSIHIYLHVVSDTVEIIPQLLPNLEVVTDEKGERSRHETVQSVIERSKVSKRIYLCHRMLKDMLFGLPKSLVDAGTSEATVHATPAPVFDPLAAPPEYVSDDEDEEAAAKMAPIITESVDDALGLFVLNRIRVDYQGAQDGSVELRNALFFDAASKADTPVLDYVPRNMAPVPVETAKIYQQWEVKLKMQQVADSQKSLSDAVNTAMVSSNTVIRRTELQVASPSRVHQFSTSRPEAVVCDAPAMMFSPKNRPHSNKESGRRWTFVV